MHETNEIRLASIVILASLVLLVPAASAASAAGGVLASAAPTAGNSHFAPRPTVETHPAQIVDESRRRRAIWFHVRRHEAWIHALKAYRHRQAVARRRAAARAAAARAAAARAPAERATA